MKSGFGMHLACDAIRFRYCIAQNGAEFLMKVAFIRQSSGLVPFVGEAQQFILTRQNFIAL